jgi:stringent starvation protein B
MADPTPTPTKPYLLRALYEWCVDNGYTPYISVAVDAQTQVPREYVRNGEIVLNLGPLAVTRLKIGNDQIELAARFGGVARDLFIPTVQVTAIYARENGMGMSFEVAQKSEAEASAAPGESEKPEPPASPSSGKPSLRVIK